jgi:hypothetical protein
MMPEAPESTPDLVQAEPPAPASPIYEPPPPPDCTIVYDGLVRELRRLEQHGATCVDCSKVATAARAGLGLPPLDDAA